MRFLLIEDNEALANAVVDRLALDGHVVDHAGDLETASEFTHTTDYDLILLDIMLPDGDGRSFLSQHRAAKSRTPVIVLTARSEVSDRVGMLDLGADDYLVKPFHPRELIAKIEAQLARAERIRAEIQRVTAQLKDVVPVECPPLPLTPAEEKVFWEVIQGHTNKKIGDHLFISPRTVQTHLSNILSKLSVKNRSQLIRFAFENGYTPPQPASRSKSVGQSDSQLASKDSALPSTAATTNKPSDQGDDQSIKAHAGQ